MAYKTILNPYTGNLQLIYIESGSGSGNVTGLSPTTTGAITRWADDTGTTIQDSPGTNVQDSGAIEAQGYITQRNVNGTVTVNTDETLITPGLTLQSGASLVIQPGGEVIIL
jgi:hypothetical protein